MALNQVFIICYVIDNQFNGSGWRFGVCNVEFENIKLHHSLLFYPFPYSSTLCVNDCATDRNGNGVEILLPSAPILQCMGVGCSFSPYKISFNYFQFLFNSPCNMPYFNMIAAVV